MERFLTVLLRFAAKQVDGNITHEDLENMEFTTTDIGKAMAECEYDHCMAVEYLLQSRDDSVNSVPLQTFETPSRSIMKTNMFDIFDKSSSNATTITTTTTSNHALVNTLGRASTATKIPRPACLTFSPIP